MEKRNEFMAAPTAEHQFPPAPPSYEDAVLKQPAYNPYLAQGTAPAYAGMQTAAAPPVLAHQQQPVVIPYVMAPPPTQIVVAVGPKSANVTCPNCRKQIKTVITTTNQKSAHLAAILCCLFGCWLCFCIPYCMNSFKNVSHKCPNCSAFLGTYKG